MTKKRKAALRKQRGPSILETLSKPSFAGKGGSSLGDRVASATPKKQCRPMLNGRALLNPISTLTRWLPAQRREMPLSCYVVLSAIIARTDNETRECFAKTATIGAAARMNIRMVRRAIAKLRELGFLESRTVRAGDFLPVGRGGRKVRANQQIVVHRLVSLDALTSSKKTLDRKRHVSGDVCVDTCLCGQVSVQTGVCVDTPPTLLTSLYLEDLNPPPTPPSKTGRGSRATGKSPVPTSSALQVARSAGKNEARGVSLRSTGLPVNSPAQAPSRTGEPPAKRKKAVKGGVSPGEPEARADDVGAVFAYWKEVLFPRWERISKKQHAIISARLDDKFTVAQLRRVVDSARVSEKNEKNSRRTVKAIFGSEDAVLALLAIAPSSSVPGGRTSSGGPSGTLGGSDRPRASSERVRSREHRATLEQNTERVDTYVAAGQVLDAINAGPGTAEVGRGRHEN